MRFRSQPTGGYVIHAVSGINTISFAIDATDADTGGLLGFAVERIDPQADEQYFMYGFKVFKSVVPAPTKELVAGIGGSRTSTSRSSTASSTTTTSARSSNR